MKILLLSIIVLMLSAKAQGCYSYHKSNHKTSPTFRLDNQSKSFFLEKKGSGTISLIAYRGMEYNYKLLSDKVLGSKVSFQVYDARTGEVIFDSGFKGYQRDFNFKCNRTTRLKVEIRSEDKTAQSGACAGLWIEYKRQS